MSPNRIQKKRLLLPSSLVPISILSILLSAAVFGLSIVNFGLLSRWYNAAAAILTITFHLVFFLLAWREHRRLAEPAMVNVLIPEPVQHTAGTSRPNIRIELPETRMKAQHDELEPEAGSPRKFTIAHIVPTIFVLSFLTIVYLLSFGIMADVTRRGGAAGTLPSERAKGMTFPWNIKVQVAQTVLVGVETLVLLTALFICVVGRMGVAREEARQREDLEYGLATPVTATEGKFLLV